MKTQEKFPYLSQSDFLHLHSIYQAENIYEGQEISQKEAILKYLKAFKPSWVTSISVQDMVTKTIINKADNTFDDSVFEWSEKDIYHFEKYNMPLNPDFITHVVKHS